MPMGDRTQLLKVSVILAGALGAAWTPLPVHDDPLVRMPGTQPADGVVLEQPGRCLNCHSGYDATVEPGSNFMGSMMAQASRDPLYWAALTVAAQDSIWATGRPNAADLCIRCHSPGGWLGGRSDPSNASRLRAEDFDGVHCDVCHRMYDPFFESTFAGTREGNDWAGYWDEADSNATTAAGVALTLDQIEASTASFFNGNAFFDGGGLPVSSGWTEHGGGQFFISAAADKRASFADAAARHGMVYSRHHKSRYFCSACHDVSNAVLANLGHEGLPPGDGTTILPSESEPPAHFGHIERTFSEFLLSDYGIGEGAPGRGAYDPSGFTTSRPGNRIVGCQDCHLADAEGAGCDKRDAPLRPTESTTHPASGVPVHDVTGGNTWVPRILASTVPGAAYDATNAGLLGQGAAALTLDLTQGEPLNADALLGAANRALVTLQRAAVIEGLDYTAGTGQATFRVRNDTGHKLISGYPEGRRMWVNVLVYRGGSLVWEINPYDEFEDTLRGLPWAGGAPPLGANEEYRDALVYEVHNESWLTGEDHTLHVALGTTRHKDNRIPPAGFRVGEATLRQCEPVWGGASAPDLFTAQEYAGGYDAVDLALPSGADGIVVSLYYQTTTREYVAFLRDEINGSGSTLPLPAPSGESSAYVAQSDPFFAGLRAWGDTIWQLWDHNRDLPGAAPILMTQAVWGTIEDPCLAPGALGTDCDDGLACTVGDLCTVSGCQGAPVVCAALDACHDAGVCNPGTGLCSNPWKPSGTGCDDGDPCTEADACVGGVCGGFAVVCPPPAACHAAGVCHSGSGNCEYQPLRDGTPCAGGECYAGSCVALGTGGAPTGGAFTGGVPTGGVPTGGVPTGGAPTGGVPTGGVPTGGAPTGGVPTGGVPTGGAPTGGVPTGGATAGVGALAGAPSAGGPSHGGDSSPGGASAGLAGTPGASGSLAGAAAAGAPPTVGGAAASGAPAATGGSSTGGIDASSGAAAGTSAPSAPSRSRDSSGCGCRAGGHQPAAPAWLLLLLIALHRRRSRSTAPTARTAEHLRARGVARD